MKISKISFISLIMISLMITGLSAGTLQKVKQNGWLTCGVSTGIVGFSAKNMSGKWEGLDVDMCKAVASAIFGDASKVKYVPLIAKKRFSALQSGQIDMLSRSTTWTVTRDISLGLNFVGVNYYDGQGFLINKEIDVNSALELDGVIICIESDTTSELNVIDYFKANKMSYKFITYDTTAQAIKGFKEGRCDVISSDASLLQGLVLKVKDPDSVKVLPEIISKEPLGPVVRQGDDQWFNIIRWTHIAMLNSEELGINSKNVDKMLKSKNPGIRRLLGTSGKTGVNLGLDAKWVYYIIKNVGNYGESFSKNVGKDSLLKIDRGLNRLWNRGGIQYGAPIR